MGHRPYPNAERALRQAQRGHATWVQPAAGGTPWLLAPGQVHVSVVKVPRAPEGWGNKAAENIRAVFAGLGQDRPYASA